MGQDRSTIANQ